MKIKYLMILIILLFIYTGCGVGSDNGGILPGGGGGNTIYKEYMRSLVESISVYAKGIDSDFLILPQNGAELVTDDGTETGSPDTDYLNAIDGMGREDLYYGYDNDNVATPSSETNYMISFLDIAEANGVEVLTTDYCWDETKMDNSYTWNAAKNYISFAADHRDLDNIPSHPTNPYNMNTSDITSLSSAKNFLYLIDPSGYSTKTDFLNALNATNYDIILIDLFYSSVELTASDISSIKTKNNGGSRIVLAYMSIGEAEDYRYYWQSSWNTTPPSWLKEENPNWPGCYKVEYWNSTWQDIIYGNDSSYLKKILDAGFDGVYLDMIDSFEYFE